MVSFTTFDTLALRSQIGAMSHKALRIYVLLSTYADRSGVCWPGIKELSDMSCLHPETVGSALDELEKMGLMVYLRRNERDPVTKRQLVNVYEIRGCLLRADSEADSERKHENETTNEITNDNNQFHKNHLHAPPPLTKPRREAEKQAAPGVDYANEQPKRTEKQKAKDKNSEAKAAPQNSKALPPLPPLPRTFKADEPLDEDGEAAARWMVEQAITRRDGGDYHAALSLANARRYIVRFGAWKCKAAVSLAKRDPATRSLVGRADYLLRTSVATEAEQLEAEMTRLYDDPDLSAE